MQEILAKRLTLLSRLVMMLFALSLFSLIHKLDSYDLEKDINAFEGIARVNEVSVDAALDSGELYNKALEYLAQADSALEAQHRIARDEVSKMLMTYGVSDDLLAEVKGRGEGSVNRFSLIEIPLDDIPGRSASSGSSQMVDDYLNRFERLTVARTLRVATTFEPAALHKYETLVAEQPETANSDPNDYMLCQPQLESVILKERDLEIYFKDPWYGGQDICESTDTLSMTTVEVPGPSLYALLHGSDPTIDDLRADQDQLNRIHVLYGQLHFDFAQSVAVQDFTQAYKSITILGFTFSTRRYPEAILLFVIITVIGIFLTVRAARRASQRIISKVEESDLVGTMLDNRWMRLIFWCVLPPAAILASLPMYPLGGTETLMFYVSAALMALVGLSAFAFARDL